MKFAQLCLEQGGLSWTW